MESHEYFELCVEIDWLKQHLSNLDDRLCKVEAGKVNGNRPTIEMVRLHGAKIGLPPEEAENFWNHYESNGWKVGRNTMKSWQSAMINWRKNWQAGVYRNSNGHDPRSLAVILHAKEKTLQGLLNQHSSEHALGRNWHNEAARQQFITLKKEIRELTSRISKIA